MLIIFKQIYSTHTWDPNRYHHFGSGWAWEYLQRRYDYPLRKVVELGPSKKWKKIILRDDRRLIVTNF